MSDKWECFLCCKEEDFNRLPSAYLSNSHPLCQICGDTILNNLDHKQRYRLTYHKNIGDIIVVSNIPVETGLHCKN